MKRPLCSKSWLRKCAKRLRRFVRLKKKLFKSGNRYQNEHAEKYLHGLMQAPNLKRNIERMGENVVAMKYDSTQHFISDSKWSPDAVYDSIIKDADKLFHGDENTCLAIDETYFQKKGKMSVGVARQWNGRLGKVENSQVAVFASAICETASISVGVEFYLPKEWTEDRARCLNAKVPESRLELKTKPELALDLIDRCLENKLRFHWVTADGGYGNNGKFLRAIDDRNLTFMIDIHGRQKFFIDFPTDLRPDWEKRNDPCENKETDSYKANSYAENLEDKDWNTVFVRDSTKGEIKVEIHEQRVYLWDEKEVHPRSWRLIITRDHATKKDIKYSLTNAYEFTPKARLAYMQRQRYWIEHSFGVMKGTCGLSDYQVRSWIGWHHHVAMVMLANLFITQEQMESPDEYCLLSSNDIREFCSIFCQIEKSRRLKFSDNWRRGILKGKAL
jgi:SRSO17 transposase